MKRDVFEEWGIADGLYINGKNIRTESPPSTDDLRKKLERN